MKISILCSDAAHPVYPWLTAWLKRNSDAHRIEICSRQQELQGGDVLFLVSCQEKVPAGVRARYQASLVIHASDLPHGRGWSPHIWQVVAGRNEITVTLLNAEDQVDSGDIWAQRTFRLAGHELADEINAQLFSAEIELMDWVIQHWGTVAPRSQAGEPSYYRRRTPEDSRIDPNRSIAEQFDLLRVADPQRFPAFFDHRGYRYRITLEKLGETPS